MYCVYWIIIILKALEKNNDAADQLLKSYFFSARVRLNLAIFNPTNIGTDPAIMKAETMMEVGNSGIVQTLDEVIFIIWVLFVWKESLV